MDYSKMTKKELIQIVEEKEGAKLSVDELKKQLEKLQRQNEILNFARKEDKEKVEEAEKLIVEFKAKEQELTQYYAQQVGHMKKTLDEQNETIVSLFDMMDNTINLQLNYYQKFKNVFINIEKKEN